MSVKLNFHCGWSMAMQILNISGKFESWKPVICKENFCCNDVNNAENLVQKHFQLKIKMRGEGVGGIKRCLLFKGHESSFNGPQCVLKSGGFS